MTDKQYYKNKYQLQLSDMSKFPVWTLQQITYYLHISNDTVTLLVNENIINKFNISRCTFYSLKDKQYTNQTIIKSIMQIDSYYRVHWFDLDNFQIDNKIEDKSLISRNVQKMGTNGNINYFNIYNINPATKFDKIIDLMIDIENLTDKRPIILIFVHDVNSKTLEDYIEDNNRIIPYLISGRLEYKIVDVNYPHFKYLQL